MGKFNTVFGNYLMGSSSVVVEEDLTLQKIYEIVNHWFINKRTNELQKTYNETTMVALNNGLMLFPPSALIIVGIIIWVHRNANKDLQEK